MTRCGSNSKHFLAARHGREIDRLHVYAVLAQEQVAQLRVLLGIADLTKKRRVRIFAEFKRGRAAAKLNDSSLNKTFMTSNTPG